MRSMISSYRDSKNRNSVLRNGLNRVRVRSEERALRSYCGDFLCSRSWMKIASLMLSSLCEK